MGLNKIVDFSNAKLLKEKGFDRKCSHYYINDFMNFKHDGILYKTDLPKDCDNENIFHYVERTKQPHLCNAPTIAEVIMWLYDKHEIWIQTPFSHNDPKPFCWSINKTIRNISEEDEDKNCWLSGVDTEDINGWNSPAQASEKAIYYALNNLLDSFA